LVVIAIISVLAGLLLPALESALTQAYSAACRSNLRQQYLAFTGYINDHDEHVPILHGILTGHHRGNNLLQTRTS
jgi:type II secretory pathway pseudopilin PulG